MGRERFLFVPSSLPCGSALWAPDLTGRKSWRYSLKCLEGEFSELRSKGVGLLRDNRLCWLRGGYGIRVAMHYLPGAAFGPKEGRNPQPEGSDVLPSSDLGPPLFHLHYAGEPFAYPLRHVLEAELAVPEVLRGTLQPIDHLLAPTREGKEGVGDGHVVPTGVEVLQGIGVSSGELIEHQVILLDHFIKIVYGSDPDCPFLSIPRDHPTLFTRVRGRRILGSSLAESCIGCRRWGRGWLLRPFTPRGGDLHLVVVDRYAGR